MKKIIAPTDFSAIAENAVHYAANMAWMLGARLILLHVQPVPLPVSELPALATPAEAVVSDARKKMNRLISKLTTLTGGNIFIDAEFRDGDVLTEIITCCDQIKPYAVVLGSESAGGFERLLQGGTTLNALKRIQWPLLVIPPQARFKDIRKIGFACDLREVVESVRIAEIKEMAEIFKADLYVIHVSKDVIERFGEETTEESVLLKEMLKDIHYKFHFIYGSDVEMEIIAYAERKNLDLLIIVPKSHEELNELFQRRHSKRFILHSPIPVLSMHA